MKDSAWDIETRRLGPPVKQEIVGRRLDEYLASEFPFFTRSGWQKEITLGHVLVNDKVIYKSSARLHLGDELARFHPLDEEPEVDTNVELLWSDGDIAVVSKPAGLPMHESGRYRRRTVAGVLPGVLGDGWAHVHRLDRETSGALVCGRTPEMRAALVESWTRRGVDKTYLGITVGVPKDVRWRVDLPIQAERHERTNRAVISSTGDPASTAFRILALSEQNALIEAKPYTGRTNQIRLHLSATGLTLVGEKVYGVDPMILEIYRNEGNSVRVQEMSGFPRHALHASRISFEHPIHSKVVSVEAPLPDDLKELCAAMTPIKTI